MSGKTAASGMIRISSATHDKTVTGDHVIRMRQPSLVRLQRLEQERLDRYGRFGKRDTKR